MIKDWVFGDPKETWFSADEFSTGSYKYEIHPGQGMHIATAWMVAYNLWHLGITYCEWNEWKLDDNAEDVDGANDDDEDQDYARTILGPTGMLAYDETVLSKILPLFHNGTNQRTQGVKPRPPPRSGLPPPLNTNTGMTMSDLNHQWKLNAKEFRQTRNRPCSRSRIDNDDDNDENDDSINDRCPFAWISGHDTSKDDAWVQEQLVSRMVSGNWTLETNYDFRKTGLTPPLPPGHIGSEMLLEFPYRKKPVGKVLIFYMKSYGIQWKDSKVRIKILQQRGKNAAASGDDDDSFREVGRTYLNGDHGTIRTSEMYVEEILLLDAVDDSIPKGGTLRIYSKLTSGTTFKIMGLLLCS
jgi:hypothetical protein